ncbi:A/G-specific adenine glycosylase [Sphingomonas jejuensis]|uniref:Adenine DNA glycosylase n=1 Tax=Sphingomonas jejuensis TaxID=904715 RepID=A0ABX0XP26_9SPHN|nr:A/G-specific adenine glycosylase [Sphingomonas jejuensis]NJC35143.1 A/G-specific adenine glycosylase [Sphingomonas jejuensis]
MLVDTPDAVAPQLLAWYDRHARALAWRSPPGAPPPDPYAVWLSEVMLQQTTTVAAAPFFRRFLERWPTVEALAAARDDDVMAAWAGLGYYARARNLLACARAVTQGGAGFPDTEAALRDLPGIGDYTAAAVAAIAFDRPATVVDGNIERVVSRLFAVADPLPGAKARLRTLAATLTPDRRPGDYAQAMMDLGATICTPRSPKCMICPLHLLCAGRASGAPERFPVKAAKIAKPRRFASAFRVERAGSILLVRRPDRGLLAGMMALPTGPFADAPPGDAGAPFAADWQGRGAAVRHVFTHFELSLQVMEAAPPPAFEGGTWWPIDRIAEAGLPTLFRKAVAA